MNPIDTIKEMTKGLHYPCEKAAQSQLTSAYYELTLEQGKNLAANAVQLDNRDTCSAILLNLALLVPGSLADIHRQLLNSISLFEWPTLFFQADPIISEELANRLSRETDVRRKKDLVIALAWTGNETAQKILFGKAQEKLNFDSDHSVEIEDLIPAAGWELTPEGRRRDLFFTNNYELDFMKGQTPHRLLSRCPSSNRRLYTPFQLHLSDPRLSFLEMAGEEVCIDTCFNCVQYGPIFMNFDTNGQSTWSSHNVRPENIEHIDYIFEVEEVFMRSQMGIGAKVRNPYEFAAWLPHNPNHLGGFPGWVQWPDYPFCVSCHKRMKFLAQLDIYGVYYAFVCSDCGVAATNAQID